MAKSAPTSGALQRQMVLHKETEGELEKQTQLFVLRLFPVAWLSVGRFKMDEYCSPAWQEGSSTRAAPNGVHERPTLDTRSQFNNNNNNFVPCFSGMVSLARSPPPSHVDRA